MRTRGLVASVVLVAAIAGGCAGAAGPTWTYAPGRVAGAAATSPVPAAPATDAPAAAAAETLRIEAFDLGFAPASIEVPAAGTYAVDFVNTGGIIHDVTFADGTKIEANAGESASGSVTVPAEGLAFICSIPGHEQGGMTGEVRVAGGAPAAGEEHEGADDHGGPPPATTVAADPNAPAPVRFDPIAPAVLDGDVHDIDLVMTEREMTIAEGFVQKVWTFGDTVPGPVIRVKLGDTVRIHLKNADTNVLPHSIDFHSSFVAWNDEMTSIDPGEEKLYEFVADKAGVFMYHCGTNPTLHHIANGM